MDNKKIGKLLKLAADLMEVKGENGFKISAYQRAARAIETLGTPVAEHARKGILSEIQGIGANTKKAILQILEKEWSKVQKYTFETPVFYIGCCK